MARIDENDPELLRMLIGNEGFGALPYKDSKGIWTFAYGYNAEAHGIPAHLVKPILDGTGISKFHAEELLKREVNVCLEDLRTIFPAFDALTRNRQLALIDMRYAMGPGSTKARSGFRGMIRMIAAVKCENWSKAALEAQDSNWYRDVKKRGPRIVQMIMEG